MKPEPAPPAPVARVAVLARGTCRKCKKTIEMKPEAFAYGCPNCGAKPNG